MRVRLLARQILEVPDLSPGDKVVGATLSFVGPLTGSPEAVARELALRCGLRERAVQRHLRRLEAAGYLESSAQAAA